MTLSDLSARMESSKSLTRACSQYVRQGENGSAVRIRTPDPDYFQILMGTSLSKDTFVIKLTHENPTTLFGDRPTSQTVENALSRNVEEYFLKKLSVSVDG